MEIVPLSDETPVLVEHLNTVVLAIRYVNPAIPITYDSMNYIELARLAP